MNPWLDGMEMLGYYSRTVLYLLLMVVWGMLIVHRFLEKRFNPHLKSEDYISLLMSGWIVPVLLWAGLYTVSVLLLGETIGTALVILVMLLSLAFVSFKPVPVSSTFMALFLLFAVFMILRFTFLKNTSLPSYFDSAEHYRLIRYFVEPAGNPPAPYYHTGFHFVGAAFVRFFDLSILDFMLAGGQFLLAILPLSLFSMIRKETNSITVGLFVVVLAGFSWHMPAHLMNWGKYPALLSLVFLSFVLNFAYLLHCNNSIKYRNSGNYLLLAIVMLVSIFVHARLLIVYGMLAAAYILASWRIRSSLKIQSIPHCGNSCFADRIHCFAKQHHTPRFVGWLHQQRWLDSHPAARIDSFRRKRISKPDLLPARFAFLLCGWSVRPRAFTQRRHSDHIGQTLCPNVDVSPALPPQRTWLGGLGPLSATTYS
jgi:hypothetical protein